MKTRYRSLVEFWAGSSNQPQASSLRHLKSPIVFSSAADPSLQSSLEPFLAPFPFCSYPPSRPSCPPHFCPQPSRPLPRLSLEPFQPSLSLLPSLRPYRTSLPLQSSPMPSLRQPPPEPPASVGCFCEAAVPSRIRRRPARADPEGLWGAPELRCCDRQGRAHQ